MGISQRWIIISVKCWVNVLRQASLYWIFSTHPSTSCLFLTNIMLSHAHQLPVRINYKLPVYRFFVTHDAVSCPNIETSSPSLERARGWAGEGYDLTRDDSRQDPSGLSKRDMCPVSVYCPRRIRWGSAKGDLFNEHTAVSLAFPDGACTEDGILVKIKVLYRNNNFSFFLGRRTAVTYL